MVAIDKRVDLFGVLFLGMLTALGGGCLRDVLLGRFPPAMFSNYVYVTVSIVTALIVFIAARLLAERYRLNEAAIDQINNVFDALGLGVFAVVGVEVSISAGYGSNGFLAVFMGMTTAICGALAYYIGWRLALPETVSLLAGVGVTFVLRLLATAFKWNLPKAW